MKIKKRKIRTTKNVLSLVSFIGGKFGRFDSSRDIDKIAGSRDPGGLEAVVPIQRGVYPFDSRGIKTNY